MRLGLISDIHANLPALDTALEELGSVDRYACPGDIVGYGPHPNECIERVRALDAVTVAGNHELIVLGELPEEGIHPWAVQTLRWTRKELTAENRDWIAALPHTTAVEPGITMAHGSLDDPRTYVKTTALARDELERLDPGEILILGHTHRQMRVEADGRLLVNPGAVGQTRERQVRAAAAMLDTEAREIAFVTVPYDTAATDAALAAAGLPARTYQMRPSLAKRLWLRVPHDTRVRINRIIGR